jgi:hypothetical protein
MVGACSNVTTTPGPGTPGPTGQPTGSAGAGTPGPTAAGPSAAPPPVFEKLPNLPWVGEGPDGWLAGELGATYRRLPENEIGVKAQDGWILSVTWREEDAVTLVIRRGSNDESPKEIELGNLLPSSVVIANDVAYLSGVPAGVAEDMRSYAIDLGGAQEPISLIKADAGNVVRNLAITPDATTLASSVCDVTEDFTVESCRLQRIVDGILLPVSEIPGLLAVTSRDVAVVVDPVGDTNPSWIAGYDVLAENVEPDSVKPFWQVDGQIERWRIDAARDELVVARFEDGDIPTFVVEAIALRSGERTVLYEDSSGGPPAFWADQSTDDFLVLASGSDIASAAAESPDGLVPVLIIDRTTGSVDPFLLSIGAST